MSPEEKEKSARLHNLWTRMMKVSHNQIKLSGLKQKSEYKLDQAKNMPYITSAKEQQMLSFKMK